mmetsp:Transcript_27982/g.59452  ORF Transcript_27982/g.59452 Transcript_27982/m.59452 type:complete len:194 (-) Transcript_27982:147-728(-)|eukprot:CAMPEP_0172531992 /NCGR_PEP_ID=MMETSP1067-20121228/5201_1 /TAXON_ID=265564 ORGANISM="Thalassiosira punctigera, Strain Tpunct2005C2" /NCGR_SAMPLE_ID=MMETSP1067 /ASSEMBLY_ACC=CAM_ASM_000444 /LENGTH=193 /DNA_ID=CAMNT_0013316447 /DNA_START=226 /DNA_END=807 /DNA_ORIENTATION=+
MSNSVAFFYFLKYEDRLLSLSFFALAPDCKPNDASSSITFPKLAVNTPTPPKTPMANRMGTYTGGNSAISRSSATAKADNGVVVRNATQPANNDCCKLFSVPTDEPATTSSMVVYDDDLSLSKEGGWGDLFFVIVGCRVLAAFNLLGENAVAPRRAKHMTTNVERKFGLLAMVAAAIVSLSSLRIQQINEDQG